MERATNGNRSSVTSACFFRLAISEIDLRGVPDGGWRACYTQDVIQFTPVYHAAFVYKQLQCTCLLPSVIHISRLQSLLQRIKSTTMKSTLILATLTALVAAQGIADLPSCSLSCLTTAITGLECGITDFACSCQKSSELTPVVTPCVQSACSDPADQSKTIEVLGGICAAAGFPIEVPVPSATSAVPLPTPTATELSPVPTTATSPEAPTETLPSATDDPEYSEYPTATGEPSEPSEYPGMCLHVPLAIFAVLTSSAPTHPTDDVPNLPSASSDHIPLPTLIDTTVPPVSLPSPTSVSLPSILPPYPSSKFTSVSVPQGTGVPTHTSSDLPEFTGAAVAAQVPMVAAGVFGLAALVW